MRRHLGPLVLASLLTLALSLVLGGCGEDDTGSVSDEPAPAASTPPAEPGSDDEPVDFELVGLVTETAVGGSEDQPAVPLSDAGSVQQFTAEFEGDTMATRVQELVQKTELPDDRLLYGAVVAVGCDTPTGVAVTSDDQGLVIAALPVPSPMMECFAPMTTVAVVLVPSSVVG